MEIQSFQRSDLQYLLSYECRMQILHDPPLYFLNGILVWQCAQNRAKEIDYLFAFTSAI